MKATRTLIGTALFLFSLSTLKAQEFPKGWVMYLEGAQGMVTNFKASPDVYTGSLMLSPQVTVVPSVLRVGAAAGLAFTGKKLLGLAGPEATLKLAQFNAGPLGSVANVQAQVQYLWGGTSERMVGGGLRAELGQLLVLGVTAHRDYNLNTWWFQGVLGFNLLHKKRSPNPPDPFSKP
ncbi:MAG TPA: hypothetical protein VK563_03735 [Puia sp.]|nr:hypothetical protein [Puia sp.]